MYQQSPELFLLLALSSPCSASKMTGRRRRSSNWTYWMSTSAFGSAGSSTESRRRLGKVHSEVLVEGIALFKRKDKADLAAPALQQSNKEPEVRYYAKRDEPRLPPVDL